MRIDDAHRYLVKRAEWHQEQAAKAKTRAERRTLSARAELLFEEADLLAAEIRQESDDGQAAARAERMIFEGIARLVEK